MLWDHDYLLFITPSAPRVCTRFKYTSLETLAVVAEGTQPSSDPSGIFGLSAAANAGGSSTSARFKRKVCEKSKIQQHIGAHILQEHWKQLSSYS